MSRKLIQTSIWFTVLSIAASALNFLYYPVASRSLSLSQFGDVQIGISFIMQAAALFTSLNTLALYFSAQKTNQSNIMARLERLVITLSVILSVIVAFFAVPISHALQLHDPSLLYVLAVIFIINIPAATWQGAIQGQGRFITSGAIAVTSSVTKIVVGVVAILAGWGAMGALFGIMVGSLIILPLCYLFQTKKTLHIRQTFRLPTLHDFKLFTERPLLFVLFGSLLLLALSSAVDVLVTKSILDPDTAGRYAQISTAAKIPYFAAIPVAIILFERLMKGLNRRLHVVPIFTGLVVAMTAITIIIEPFVMQVFFGAEPHSYSSAAFVALSIAFACYAITTLLIYSLISHRHIARVAFASIVTFGAPIILLTVYAHDVVSVSYLYLTAQGIALLVATGLQYTNKHD